MAFDLPTKQPTKITKPIILEAIDTEDQAPVEAPKKKVAKKSAKKKAEPKHESKKEATEQPNAFFRKLQITEPKAEKLSTNISDAKLTEVRAPY